MKAESPAVFPKGRPDKSFFRQEDVTAIARQLLGKFLVTNIGGEITSGMIVETEAYRGPEDKACHAWNNKKTARTRPMFEAGGIAYVYLCYGIHHLFNVVTGPKDMPHAVLIRALEPADNAETMMKRRKQSRISTKLSAGPGILAQALGITTGLSGQSLLDPESPVWIEDRGIYPGENLLSESRRIGVDYAGEWALKKWRFCIKDNPWISKPG